MPARGPVAPFASPPTASGTIYKRFRRWVDQGILATISTSRQETWDPEVRMVDGSYLPAHPSSTGARKQGRTPAPSHVVQASGRRGGGLTTKLWAHGLCVRFRLWPGNAAEVTALAALLAGVPTAATQRLP